MDSKDLPTRYVVFLTDGRRVLLVKGPTDGCLWRLPCNRMFDVVPSKEHVRQNVVRKVLDSLSLGSALAWIDEVHGPLDIRHHAKVFGLDGHLLEVHLGSHIFSSLEVSCRKGRDFFVQFVDETYKDRVHKTTSLDIHDILAHMASARKKICPEAVHAVRHVNLGQASSGTTSDRPQSNKDDARDLDA